MKPDSKGGALTNASMTSHGDGGWDLVTKGKGRGGNPSFVQT